jgi:hypothetical protein
MERTRINSATLALALLYLQRLKASSPETTGTHGSGHRLLLAAIILASKYLYDDSYDNTAWAKVSMGLVEIKEVNAIERELLDYLQFNVGVARWEWLKWIATLQHWLVQSSSSKDMSHLLFAKEMCNVCSMDEEIRGGGCGIVECMCSAFSQQLKC